MRRFLLPLLVVGLALGGCKGLGMGQMSSKGWDAQGEEAAADEKFWDKLYGRKAISRESSDWKDFYSAPNTDQTKPDYCGYWGNCAPAGAAQASDCNFYGNCASGDSAKKGWW